MVYAVYIVAAVAVGLLIGFVVLSISVLRTTVSSNIRSKTISLISVYDDLLDEKSRELAEIASDCESAEAAISGINEGVRCATENRNRATTARELSASEMMNIAEHSGGAMYRDDAMGSLYRKIRDNFSFKLEEVVSGLSKPQNNTENTAEKLLEELDYDTVYRLSTLPEEYQVAVLKETLIGEELDLFDSYLTQNGRFNALDFYYNLRTAAELASKGVRLHVPAGVVTERINKDGVEIIPDEGICEGFQLEEGNVLYDYCIKTRELS